MGTFKHAIALVLLNISVTVATEHGNSGSGLYYMQDMCVDGQRGKISMKKEGITHGSLYLYPLYDSNMNCDVIIDSNSKWSRILITVNDFSTGMGDSLSIYDGDDVKDSKLLLSLSGVKPTVIVSSNEDEVLVKFTSDSIGTSTEFSIDFTKFYTGSDCDSDEFMCSDGKCISSDLQCDGKEQCEVFTADDMYCTEYPDTNEATPNAFVLIIAVSLCALLTAIIIIIITLRCMCYRMKRRPGVTVTQHSPALYSVEYETEAKDGPTNDDPPPPYPGTSHNIQNPPPPYPAMSQDIQNPPTLYPRMSHDTQE